MGLFGGGNSSKKTYNEDNRSITEIHDNSYKDSSTHDNSYTDTSTSFADNSYSDSSTAFEDNSYIDGSTTFNDNSYNDASIHETDNSYHDTSTNIDGEYAGNSGTITITDGGAFTTVQNAVSDLVQFGDSSLTTAGNAFAEANVTAREVVEELGIIVQNIDEAYGELGTTTANVVASATQSMTEGYEATQKAITTDRQNGNDLLVNGVVDIVKYGGMAVGGLGLAFMAFKYFGSKKK